MRLGIAAAVIAVWCGLSSAAGADAPVRILAFGDSLTAGLGLPRTAALPSQLEGALRASGIDATVINAGVSGDTTAGGLARLAWSLQDKSDLVILALGGNDGLRGIEPAETRRNLSAMLETLRRARVAVLLAGMYAPPNLGREYEAEFNRIYPELAEEYGAALYPFLLEGVALEPHLNQADGIHPNRRGVQVIVAGILPHVVRVLADRETRAAIAPPGS